jgi:hypothetical protein
VIRRILTVFFLAVVCASSQQPSPTPAKTIQEVQDKRPDAGTKADSAQPTASPIGKQDRGKGTDESDQPPTDNRIVWLTGALVLVGFLQVFVYWKQAGLMRDGLAETKKAADAAVTAANAAQRGLILSNRPKIEVTGITFNLPDGTVRGTEISQLSSHEVQGQIHLINSGNTPGRITRMYSAVHIGKAIPEKPPSECIKCLDMLLPSGVRSGVDFPTKGFGKITEQHLPARIEAGDEILWIYGWLEYVDDMKNQRTTRFCRLWCRNTHRMIPFNDRDYESAD